MYDNYLIPANTKRGKLILGWFRPFDLYLFGGGILVTFILIAFLPLSNALVAVLCFIIQEGYEFLTTRQRYRWKGWCWKSGVIKKKKR